MSMCVLIGARSRVSMTSASKARTGNPDQPVAADYTFLEAFDLGSFGGAIFFTAPVNRSHPSGAISTAIAAFTFHRRFDGAFGFACC